MSKDQKVIKDVSIAPQAGDNFAVASFRASIPENPTAVIVMVPGSNGDGRDMITSSRWEDLASKHNAALVGCRFQDVGPSQVEWYANAQHGSGAALMLTLNYMGLEGLPLFLWGFSAGGEFNYEFACWLAPLEPHRIKAFVVNKGGIYYTALAPEATRQIPALWFIGGADAQYRKSILHGIYDMNAAVGCQWKKVVEPVDHVIGSSDRRTLEFFEGLLS